MNYIEMIGYSATFFGAIQLIPEIAKALKTHHLKDLSWGMLFLMLFSSILWIIYGAASNVIPLVISASMNFVFELTLTLLKLKYLKAKMPLLRPAVEKQLVVEDN
jgi:MtN3 and saliva related transmembrane protein